MFLRAQLGGFVVVIKLEWDTVQQYLYLCGTWTVAGCPRVRGWLFSNVVAAGAATDL